MSSQNQKDNPVTNVIMEQLLNGSNKQGQHSQEAIQMPELALRCAQFFHSLSQYCLYFYKNYNKEADVHKTKLIKKADKHRKDKNDKSKKRHQQKRARMQRGQHEPEPPKKPLTAYIIYFQDKKPAFAQKFPSLSLSQLTKLIAKDWKDLKDEQKKPYLDKAANDRKRYQIQITQFKKKYMRGPNGQLVLIPHNEAQQGKQEAILQAKGQQIPIQIQDQNIPQQLLIKQLNEQIQNEEKQQMEKKDEFSPEQQEGQDEDGEGDQQGDNDNDGQQNNDNEGDNENDNDNEQDNEDDQEEDDEDQQIELEQSEQQQKIDEE